MNELYLAALRNDTGYIKKYLEEHLDHLEWINKPFEPSTSAIDSVKKMGSFSGAQVVIIGVASLTTGPISFVFWGYSLYESVRIVRETKNEFWVESYEGWTLLECAIYSGASETASILISKGAEITPRAKEILDQKKLKNPQLVDLVKNSENDRTGRLYLESQLSGLREKLQITKANKNKLQEDLAKFQSVQDPRKDEVSRLKEEIENQKTKKREYKNQLISLASIMREKGFFQPDAHTSEQSNAEACPKSSIDSTRVLL